MQTNPKTTASDKAIIKEKFLIDYLSYTSFVLLKPENSNLHFMRSMWRTSMSGLVIIFILTWGGFLIHEFYMTKLLSSLTLPYYERPIEDIPGTQCGNFMIFLSLRFYVKSILVILEV